MKNLKNLLFLLCFCCKIVSAQNVAPFSYNTEFTPSVETYSIVKYGGIKPALYTGSMTYSLPLHIYKDEDFEFPISLEYTFDGYKPATHSGSVGYGWRLNYGGVITREIYGYPDDLSGSDNEDKFDGYYRTIADGILNKLGSEYELASGVIAGADFIGENASVRSVINVFADNPIYTNVPTVSSYASRRYDTNPDIFQFNFLGNSGKFMMKSDGTMEVFDSNIPKGEIKIEYDFTKRSDLPESEIIITTGEGYKYIFGGDYSTMEYSIPATTETYPTVVAWKLRKVEAPNGNYIELIYDPLLAHDIRITNAYTPLISPEYTDEFYRYQSIQEISTAVNSLYPIVKQIKVNGKTIYSFDIEEHNYDENSSNCFLDPHNAIKSFGYAAYYSSSPRSINSISIMNYEGELIDTIEMGHFFVGNQVPRMLLSDVRFREGKFAFEYENLNPPVNDTKSVDHWGFWNGQSSTLGIPYLLKNTYRNLYDQFEPSVTCKEPSLDYAKKGGLKKIIYPTGGCNVIEYEKNSANKLIDKSFGYCPDLCNASNLETPVAIGGARVKSISTINNDVINTISYEYLTDIEGNTSSGILLKMPLYSLRANYKLKVSDISTNELNISALAFTDEASSNLPTDPFITYSRVQEVFPDGSYIEHTFNTYENKYDWYNNSLDLCTFHKKTFSYETDAIWCDDGDTQYPISLRKTLLPKYKDYSSCRGKLISKSEYDNNGILKKKTSYTYTDVLECERQMFYNTIIDFTEMPLYIYSSRLSNVAEYIYDAGRCISSGTSYLYNDKGQVSQVSQIYDSSMKTTYYRYYTDINSTISNPSLRSAISDVVQTVSVDGGPSYLLSNTHYQYSTSGKNGKPTKVTRYDSATPSTCTLNMNLYVVPTNYYASVYNFTYDTSKYRLLQASAPGGAFISYTWDNSNRHIISKTKNSDVNTYSYEWKDLVGPTKITTPTADFMVYEYDSKNRLAKEIDSNGSLVQSYQYHYNNE